MQYPPADPTAHPPSPPSGQFGSPKMPPAMDKTGALGWYGRQRRATKAGIVCVIAVLLIFSSLGLMTYMRSQAKDSTTVILPTQTTTSTAVPQNTGSPTAAPSATPTMVSMQVAVVTPVVPTPYPTWTPIPTPTKAPTPTTPPVKTILTVIASAIPTIPTNPIRRRKQPPLPIP